MSEPTTDPIDALAPNDPRAQEELRLRRAAIGLGFDVEAFMSSDIGRFFQLRASREMEEAQEALTAANPFEPREIQALQQKAQVAQRVLTWFAEAVTEGENAQRELQAFEAHQD